MKKYTVLFFCMFSFMLIKSQINENLGAQHALQKSEIIKAIPQESNGYLVMNKNKDVNHWIVKVMDDNLVRATYRTEMEENHVRIDSEIFNNWSYKYKIQGISTTGEIIIDIDVKPINGDPVWIYNDCNRPTCVKTSGSSNYAYAMTLSENINNDSYKLSLRRAWSHVDNTSGIQIPYYIEVSQNNLSAALAAQNLTYANGIQSPQTYFFDNGMYKVALGLGVWDIDQGATTNQINGVGGEGCTLSFASALNRMNASAQLSTTLACTGQHFSQNESGGGNNPPGLGGYPSASSSILDCSALFSNTTTTYNYHWEQVIDGSGLISYILVMEIISTNVAVDCDETTTPPNPSNPCPPGYYYAPGGGDPCKPITPIVERLQKINLIPIDVEIEGQGDENTLEKGLYLAVLNFDDGVSIPIYKKFENKISLGENRANSTDKLIVFPNPVKDELTLSINEDENILSYSIFDNLGNEVKKGDFSSKLNEQTIALNELKEGIYLLNIETNKQSYKKKIIKE